MNEEEEKTEDTPKESEKADESKAEESPEGDPETPEAVLYCQNRLRFHLISVKFV